MPFQPTFHMRGSNTPYLLLFSSYLTFKFWSRDHVVTWLFPNFFESSNKCPINQPFICGAKICCSCFGSLVIWLSNFDHVTTRSRDFSKNFKAFSGLYPMGPYQVCSVNWPYLLWFSQNKTPRHCLYVCIYIYVNHGKFHSFTVIKRKIAGIPIFLCGLIFMKRTIVQNLESKFQL